MALKSMYMSEYLWTTYFFTGIGERGGIASLNKEQPHANKGILTVSYNEDTTCKPVGILCCDVVDIDLYKTPYAFDNNKVRKGSVVKIISNAVVVTNQIVGEPKPGHMGLMYQKGQILVYDYPKLPKSMRKYFVGRFLSGKDQDGFAKFSIGVL